MIYLKFICKGGKMLKIFIFDQTQDFKPDFNFGISEKERLSSLKNSNRRLESESALCALARLISLSDYTPNFEILRDENGKPYFKNSEIAFSLSHSGNISVAAIFDNECGNIGIDVEKITNRPDISRLAKRFFTFNELDQLKRSAFSPDCFFDIWTKKEAQAKISGIGLAKILNNNAEKTIPPIFEYSYEFFNNSDKYFLSVCVNRRPRNIEIYNNSKNISIGKTI